jgi:tRNA G37 N-methylase Trm5
MMKSITLGNTMSAPRWRATVAVVLGFCLASCADNERSVPKSEYSTKIVGQWQGTVGNEKETMQLNGEGTFVCQIHQTGFLANTLSQSLPGKVSGTWSITGVIVTLKITGEKHEHLRDRVATSTIESFKADELLLKSDRGETSLFQRLHAF